MRQTARRRKALVVCRGHPTGCCLSFCSEEFIFENRDPRPQLVVLIIGGVKRGEERWTLSSNTQAKMRGCVTRAEFQRQRHHPGPRSVLRYYHYTVNQEKSKSKAKLLVPRDGSAVLKRLTSPLEGASYDRGTNRTFWADIYFQG